MAIILKRQGMLDQREISGFVGCVAAAGFGLVGLGCVGWLDGLRVLAVTTALGMRYAVCGQCG